MARLSTHVLDTAAGRPASGVEVRLYSAARDLLKTVTTDAGGRALVDENLAPGVYELVFGVGVSAFLNEIVVRFGIADGEAKYHVPLLVSPYGYTTYRGIVMDAHEVIRRCRELAECTEEPGHITRTFLSPPMREVHARAGAWMRGAGLRVSVDSVGNLRGVRGDGPRLMIGSHLDTVPRGGAFDGVLGVMMAVALCGAAPGPPLEVVGFSEEEGVRFGVPFIGSRALVGDPVISAEVLEAIRGFGLDPAEIPRAGLSPDVREFLEFHIEQGPVLESLGLPLGVVETIAGQSRFEVRFTGKANHAGTTPMNLRQDALAGAAEWIGVVEREGATVGRIAAEPGVANVIAGVARLSLDVRHASDGERTSATQRILSGAREIALRRGLAVEWEQKLDQPAVAMQCEALERAVEAAGYPVHRMVSGAGHDAMILARKVPAAMLFLRSPGGISHHPDESVLPEDVTAALAVGAKYLDAWRPE